MYVTYISVGLIKTKIMKYNYLLLALLITTFSFSQNIKEIKHSSFTPVVGSTISENGYTQKFENGKLIEEISLKGGYTKFDYNELGQLASAVEYRQDGEVFYCQYFKYDNDGIINKTYAASQEKCKIENIEELLGGSDITVTIKDSLNYEIHNDHRNNGSYKPSLKYTGKTLYKRKNQKLESIVTIAGKQLKTVYQVEGGNIMSRNKKDVFEYKYDDQTNIYLTLLNNIYNNKPFINSLIYNPFEFARYSRVDLLTQNNPTESKVTKSTNYQAKVRIIMKYSYEDDKLTEINSEMEIERGTATTKTIFVYE